jgi:hypothetical protein
LMPDGDTAHAYLLAHGLVTAHVTLPETPPFVAAVELGASQGPLTPNQLREAVTPLLPALVHQAVGLILDGPGAGPERVRARMARLLLLAARRGLRAEEIERVPAFRTVGGAALVDLGTLRRSATAGTLLALSPGDPPERYALGGATVLVAGEPERRLAADVLAVRLATPSRRESPHSLGGGIRRLLRGVGRAAADWGDRLRHPLRPPPVPEEVLTPEEHALLLAVRAEVRAKGAALGNVILCEGAGPVRRAGGRPPVLLLPRHNPVVVACVRAFGTDPGWMRLIRYALVEGSG